MKKKFALSLVALLVRPFSQLVEKYPITTQQQLVQKLAIRLNLVLTLKNQVK